MNSSRKVSTARKASGSKIKMESKSGIVKKNPSDKLKKVKKKASMVEESHLEEC